MRCCQKIASPIYSKLVEGRHHGKNHDNSLFVCPGGSRNFDPPPQRIYLVRKAKGNHRTQTMPFRKTHGAGPDRRCSQKGQVLSGLVHYSFILRMKEVGESPAPVE